MSRFRSQRLEIELLFTSRDFHFKVFFHLKIPSFSRKKHIKNLRFLILISKNLPISVLYSHLFP